MNFTDAVRELAEGRCEGISCFDTFALNKDMQWYLREGYEFGCKPSKLSLETILRDDWQLVNPKPVMEEKEKQIIMQSCQVLMF